LQLKSHLKGLLPYGLAFFIIVPLDQLTKLWVRTSFYLGESRPPSGFLRFTYIQNTGASFGIFPDGNMFFTIFSTISLVAIIVLMFFFRRQIFLLDSLPGKLAMGLIGAGTLGNLIDRYCLGYVVDFINFSIWPAFNIADSAIVIGAILLAFLILVYYRQDEAKSGGRI
jgi:signal peptidase II